MANELRSLKASVQEMKDEYLGSSSPEIFKKWLAEHADKNDYTLFLHWVLGDDWGYITKSCAATFVNIGTASPDVMDALVKGLRTGVICVLEWLDAIMLGFDVTDPWEHGKKTGVLVAELLVRKGLIDSQHISMSNHGTPFFKAYERMKALEPFLLGPPPSWW